MLILFISISQTFASQPERSSDSLLVTDIKIVGNKKTREHVILREMTFAVNSYIMSSDIDTLIAINKNHIFNTHLFLDVLIDSRIAKNNSIGFIIIVKERWYTIPSLVLELADRSLNEWWYLFDHDINRVEYGLMLTQQNCRGRNETFTGLINSGFSQQLYFSYDVPYFAKNQKRGLLLVAQYLRNREFAIGTNQANELEYLRMDDFIRKRMRFDAVFSYRNNITNTHSINLSYNQDEINDTITELNPVYFGSGEKRQQYFALRYVFESNKTNIHYYPTNGYYSRIELSKQGLSIFKDVNHLKLNALFSAYKPISKRLFFATQISGIVSTEKNQPFLLAPNLGYHGIYVRSFEYYLVKGQAYFLNRNEIKYRLFSSVLEIKFIHWPKFNRIPVNAYMKLFADEGYVYDVANFNSYNLQNKWLLSTGVGLDLVTYYDMVFRFEYGWNNLKENAFFLHVNKAI